MSFDPDIGPVDGYATIEFFPDYEKGMLDFNDFYVYGYTTTPGNPTTGTINMDTLCVTFIQNNTMRLTFVLQDQAGLTSNPLVLNVPRPIDAISVQDSQISAAWSVSE